LQVSATRIGVLLLAMAGIAIGMFAFVAQPERLPPDTNGSWLELPDDMDARRPGVRMLLARVIDPRDPYGSLMFSCGRNPLEPPEQYVIHIGDTFGVPDPEFWEVRIVPRGSTFHVRIKDALPRPPPPPGVHGTGGDLETPQYFVVEASEMTEIGAPLRTDALWSSPQADVACLDGNPVTMEACIHGQYAARHRNCDSAAYEQATLLWEALQRRFGGVQLTRALPATKP